MRKKVFDILWSDPQHNEGCKSNSVRGAGTYFGPDVTEKFLEKHKLSFLIRSHECKHDGYEIAHAGKVRTSTSTNNIKNHSCKVNIYKNQFVFIHGPLILCR